MTYTTGDLDIYYMAVNADGNQVFVNTLFGRLAIASETHSIKPRGVLPSSASLRRRIAAT